MKISDEQLTELIRDFQPRADYSTSAEKYAAIVLSALAELQSLRRTEQRVVALLQTDDSREIELGIDYATLTRHCGATNERTATADTPFAALAKLMEAVARHLRPVRRSPPAG